MMMYVNLLMFVRSCLKMDFEIGKSFKGTGTRKSIFFFLLEFPSKSSLKSRVVRCLLMNSHSLSTCPRPLPLDFQNIWFSSGVACTEKNFNMPLLES